MEGLIEEEEEEQEQQEEDAEDAAIGPTATNKKKTEKQRKKEKAERIKVNGVDSLHKQVLLETLNCSIYFNRSCKGKPSAR